MNIAATSEGYDLRALVRHLRETGQLTAGLILRALLSGNTEMFEFALAELDRHERGEGGGHPARARRLRRRPRC